MTEITQKELQTLLRYDAVTGHFYWNKLGKQRRSRDGHAGHTDDNGYRIIRIKGKAYKAHRLAWLYVYGKFPSICIDHINGVRTDNRIANLRDTSKSANSRNRKLSTLNRAGYSGVAWNRHRTKWVCTIGVNGSRTVVGSFACLGKAIAARKAAEIKFGYHLEKPTRDKTFNRALWHLANEFAKLKASAA